MKVAINGVTSAVGIQPISLNQRIADYFEMTKPRIAVMALITVAVGYLMAAGADAKIVPLIHVLIGSGLVAAGSSVWNQWIERTSDTRMRRTLNRPLPANRIHHLEAVILGTALGVTGINYLLHAFASPMAAIVAAFTFFCYVAIYTPLKPYTTFNTLIGAIPGALPPVIGWCAVKDAPIWPAVTLFAVIFAWQLPHFMAIAWMYREEYAKAGLKMLPTVDLSGSKTCRSMILWTAVLIGVSLLPIFMNKFDVFYTVGIVAIGLYFLRSTIQFVADRSIWRARRVLRASIIYLPLMMGLILMHGFVTGK